MNRGIGITLVLEGRCNAYGKASPTLHFIDTQFKPMSEETQQNWHQKPLVRLLLLLLLPAILFGLYMASNWLAFRKAPSVPVTPEPSPTTG